MGVEGKLNHPEFRSLIDFLRLEAELIIIFRAAVASVFRRVSILFYSILRVVADSGEDANK